MEVKELEKEKALQVPKGWVRDRFENVVMGARFMHDGQIYQKVNDFRDGEPIYRNNMAEGGTQGAKKVIPDCEPDLVVHASPESLKNRGSF